MTGRAKRPRTAALSLALLLLRSVVQKNTIISEQNRNKTENIRKGLTLRRQIFIGVVVASSKKAATCFIHNGNVIHLHAN